MFPKTVWAPHWITLCSTAVRMWRCYYSTLLFSTRCALGLVNGKASFQCLRTYAQIVWCHVIHLFNNIWCVWITRAHVLLFQCVAEVVLYGDAVLRFVSLHGYSGCVLPASREYAEFWKHKITITYWPSFQINSSLCINLARQLTFASDSCCLHSRKSNSLLVTDASVNRELGCCL